MTPFRSYVDSILVDLVATKEEKRELSEEFIDHLFMLKQEFLEKDYTEEEATQLAINAFGQSSELTPQLQACLNLEYSKWKPFLQGVLLLYLSWYIYYYSVKFFDLNLAVYGNVLRDHFTYQINPIDLFRWISLESIVRILLSSFIIYGPLGFLWTLLFRKSFITNLLTSFCIFQAFHLFTFVIKLNMFDINRILFHLVGFTLGYFLCKMGGRIIDKLVQFKHNVLSNKQKFKSN